MPSLTPFSTFYLFAPVNEVDWPHHQHGTCTTCQGRRALDLRYPSAHLMDPPQHVTRSKYTLAPLRPTHSKIEPYGADPTFFLGDSNVLNGCISQNKVIESIGLNFSVSLESHRYVVTFARCWHLLRLTQTYATTYHPSWPHYLTLNLYHSF